MKRSNVITFISALIFFFLSEKSYCQDISIPLNKLSAYSVTDWQTFVIKEQTLSFLIEVTGASKTTYQITDLIAPDGTVYVQSHLNVDKISGYELPHAHNQKGKNRSLSVIEKQSALLVPNFYTEEPLPFGVWKYRVLGNTYIEKDSVKVNVVQVEKRNNKRKINIKLYIEKDSFWLQNPNYTQEMIAHAKNTYKNHDIHLEISTESFHSKISNYDAPKDILTLMETNAFIENTPELSVKYLLIGKMLYQDKPINGLSCLSGFASQSNCFATLFADPLLANTITPLQAGKIFTHELGHHLGLFHTKDENLMFLGSVLDPFSDTSDLVSGENIMDPGIHNLVPEFSKQQIHVLRLHPLVQNY